jgi:hypothetical protein
MEATREPFHLVIQMTFRTVKVDGHTHKCYLNLYFVRFQVLTAASMMFRVVFWDILPCNDDP